jgi:hypothetical protein
MNSSSTVAGRWRDTLAGLARALRHWPWYATLRTLQLRFREDHLALTASSLSFTTLISLVPLVPLETVMLAFGRHKQSRRGHSDPTSHHRLGAPKLRQLPRRPSPSARTAAA